MNKLAIFDLDSTLLAVESINVILNKVIKNPKEQKRLEEIRAQSMRGDLDLETSLIQRIALFKGLELKKLKQLCQVMPWTTGAQETIAELQQRGYLTVCISAGFHTTTRRVINELGVDAYYCNTLKHQNGILTGHISGDLMHHSSKGKILKKIQKKLDISPAETLAVGDGANDISMFKHADTSIAFCAQDILKDHATHIVQTDDLSNILPIIKNHNVQRHHQHNANNK